MALDQHVALLWWFGALLCLNIKYYSPRKPKKVKCCPQEWSILSHFNQFLSHTLPITLLLLFDHICHKQFIFYHFWPILPSLLHFLTPNPFCPIFHYLNRGSCTSVFHHFGSLAAYVSLCLLTCSLLSIIPVLSITFWTADLPRLKTASQHLWVSHCTAH